MWQEEIALKGLPKDRASSPTWSQGLLAVGGSILQHLPAAQSCVCRKPQMDPALGVDLFLYVIPTGALLLAE